jgi:hypothetical protein
VFAEVIRCSDKPGIRNGIDLELILDAKLSQARPLRPKRRKVNTGASMNATASSLGVGSRKILGLLTRRRKLATTIGIKTSLPPEAATAAARSSQLRAMV